MNLDSLKAFVKASSLTDDVKEVLIDRLEAEGLTTDVVDALKQAFQDNLDDLFDAAGVKLDPKDPEFIAQHQQYADEVDAASQEMEDGVALIEADLQKTLHAVDGDIDAIHAEKIRSDLP
jgi:protoporphyrinogen oxidase